LDFIGLDLMHSWCVTVLDRPVIWTVWR